MRRRTWFVAGVMVVVLASISAGVLRAAVSMPRGYVIAEITVTDPLAYKEYAAAATPIVAKFGGKYLVRGGQTVPVEGDVPAGRIVVIEFDSLAAARAFEGSQDYLAIAPLRQRAAHSRVFLAEGLPR